MTDKEILQVIKYYEGFATTKQKEIINKLLHKTEHTDKDITKLKKYAFKYKMYITSNSMNVDSRLDKIRNSPYNISNQYKHKVKKQYFKHK